MEQGDSHPITTPKGAATLSIILAVIGVFLPFFTSLQTAQLFTGIAVLVIGWLYAGEAWEAVQKHAGYARLIAPVISILIVIGVAIGATWVVNNQPQTPAPQPAITPRDVSNAVEVAIQRNNASKPIPLEPTMAEHRYQIVIQEPEIIPDPPRPAPSTRQPIDSIPELKKISARINAGQEEYLACIGQHGKITRGLYQLIVDATQLQNAYFYGKSDKKMENDLKEWSSNIDAFFSDNKEFLPDVSLVRLANEGQRVRDSGDRAWASMNAKRMVLETIQSDGMKKSCEAIKNAAIAKCLDSGQC